MQLKVVRLFFLIFLLQLTLQAKNINLNEYLESANKANKHLFVWLHKSYCNYCERMKEFTVDKRLPKLLKNDRGIFAKALNSATIKIGDSVCVEEVIF